LQLRKGLILLVALLLFAGLMLGCAQSETEQGTGQESEQGVEEGTETPPVEETTEQKLQGEGQGANPDVPIKVEVTMVDGKITAIEILEHEEPEGSSELALEQIPVAIIAAQSTDVEVVPEAPETSEGIMEAVANATGL
jgi:urocanate reductase